MKVEFLIACVFSVFSLNACFEFEKWTEEEKKSVKIACETKQVLNAETIEFAGFQLDEIVRISIIEKTEDKAIDTLSVRSKINHHNSHSEIYSIELPVNLNIRSKYEFFLGDDLPYVLDSMEMTLWPQFTMFSEGYACVIGKYKIDNKKHTDVNGIKFKKRGFQPSWEK